MLGLFDPLSNAPCQIPSEERVRMGQFSVRFSKDDYKSHVDCQSAG